MKSLTLTLDTNFTDLVKNIDSIIQHTESKVVRKKGFEYLLTFSGNVSFKKTTAKYWFETLDELREALTVEDIKESYLWALEIKIREKEIKDYSSPATVMNVSFERGITHGGVEVDINDMPFRKAKQLMDEVAKILKCSYIIIPTKTEVEIRAERLDKEKKACVEKCIRILEDLPELQARIRKPLGNEKDVQDYIFPILKSHFSDLQEEDYLAKNASIASKPDFGIESMGLAIEVKYTSAKKTFKKLTSEINDDSRQYFGRTSPFETMVVLIYNGSAEPIPANYVLDLEHIDVVSKVIISPAILPTPKIN